MTAIALQPCVLAQPLTSHCQEVSARAERVTVGISPFNGYYTQERIDALVAWSLGAFPRVSYYVPDLSPQHTFLALGYPEGKARTKARRQGAYVLNKIRTALARCTDADPEPLLLWSGTLADNPAYQELAARGRDRFAQDDAFRTATLDTSRWVLAGKLPDGAEPTLEQQELAVEYFLDELPLFLDTPAITGLGPSLFAYHQPVDYLGRLYQGELGLTPSPDQGFVVAHAQLPERADSDDLVGADR